MRTISRSILLPAILFFALLSNFGSSFSRDNRNHLKPGSEIAGHRILKTLPMPEDHNTVTSDVLFQDNAGLFYLPQRGSLHVYDEAHNQWKTYTYQDLNLGRGEQIHWMAESPDQRIWYTPGSLYGLHVFEDGRGRAIEDFRLSSVNILFPAIGKGFWACSPGFLHYYDGEIWSEPISTDKPTEKLKLGDISAGIQDRKGLIWLTCSDGIARYEPKQKEWTAFLHPQVPTSPLKHIYEDKNGDMWFANTLGDMIFYERKSSSWVRFNLEDKVSDVGSLYGMLEDKKGQMLFATFYGVVGFDGSKHQWNLYTARNSGLPDSLVYCMYKDRSERIWMVTARGLVVLTP
jgi:ligand-binding sensor domain-containing protein